jgi:hypothetical protein
MMGTFFRVDNDYEGSFWGYGDEVWVGHGVTFPTRRVNFVRGEGNAAIEFANGVNNHSEF